jgi:hypothetical protein
MSISLHDKKKMMNQLNSIRHSRFWAYDTLAKAIGISVPTLYRFDNSPDMPIKAFTLNKIIKFIQANSVDFSFECIKCGHKLGASLDVK